MLRAGLLNRLVTIQALNIGKNADGELIREWVDMYKTWSRRENLSGRELEAAQSVFAEVTTRFTIRYRQGLHAKMRILCDDEIHHVQAVLDRTGARVELHLLCSSGLTDG